MSLHALLGYSSTQRTFAGHLKSLGAGVLRGFVCAWEDIGPHCFSSTCRLAPRNAFLFVSTVWACSITTKSKVLAMVRCRVRRACALLGSSYWALKL